MKEREHGKYTEVKQEKDLIKLTTTTPFVVAHFFMPNFRRCEIVDRHLTVRHLCAHAAPHARPLARRADTCVCRA